MKNTRHRFLHRPPRRATGTSTINGSHYKNEIVSIDGVQDFFYGPISTRFGNQVINKVGSPIGSFYGYKTAGFFSDAADVAAHATQDGAAPGRIKFADMNGDGKITSTIAPIIGSPHPNFTGGLDLGYRRGNWDLSRNRVRLVRERYLRRTRRSSTSSANFSTNVRKDLLTNSWTPREPEREVSEARRGRSSTATRLSSFYVEDGSYIETSQPAARATTSRRRCRGGCRLDASMCRERTCSRSPVTRSRSVAARGEHYWTRRRHPRSVSRHRSRLVSEQQSVQHRHSSRRSNHPTFFKEMRR